MSEWRIPLSDLDYDREEEAAVLRVLRSKWLSMGPEVAAFEQEFAACLGSKHALAVANGTAALHLALLALDVGPGDEIVQPAINFVAASNMTAAVGATPVFADIIGLDEPTIDPKAVERLLTPRTKAVVVMHYGGYLCRMAEIADHCRERKVALIEDACHAVGGRYVDDGQRLPHGLSAGAIGDVGCFSFFSNKNLATGEGGMVVTNRDDVAERLRRLRSHGMTSLTWDRHRGHANTYDVTCHGYNYRLDDLHAALGRVQLKKLTRNNECRKRLVEIYRQEMSQLKSWIVPFAADRGAGSYHLMVAVANDADSRNSARSALKGEGIQTSMHYPCVPDFSAFSHFAQSAVPKSRMFAERALTLPLFPGLTGSQIHEIVAVLARTSRTASVREKVR
jgi:dTDP-4-amino-4,6-dideoxygalactose transaminase